METKKIEKVDLDQLQSIRDKYAENNVKLGMITADEYFINQQLTELGTLKEECYSIIEHIKNEEQTLVESLKEKYGEGQINIDEGIFISMPQV